MTYAELEAELKRRAVADSENIWSPAFAIQFALAEAKHLHIDPLAKTLMLAAESAEALHRNESLNADSLRFRIGILARSMRDLLEKLSDQSARNLEALPFGDQPEHTDDGPEPRGAA
jgi:hypothetical protein